MIIKEFFLKRDDGVNLCRIYSDRKVQIQKIGTSEFYDEAIDIETATFKYLETNIKIKTYEEPVIEENTPPVVEEGDDTELTTDEIVAQLKEVF